MKMVFAMLYSQLFGYRPNSYELMYMFKNIYIRIKGFHIILCYEARDIVDIQKGKDVYGDWVSFRHVIL